MDVTTMGEMRIALSGGMPAERLGFHGNNKSAEEIRFALEQGVGRIIVDSFHEIDRIETACRELGRKAHALVRVTTGVEAHTHEYIATAHEDQKFGLSILGGHALAALVRCQSSPFIELRGIHSHIGSQIFETHGFEVAIRRTLRLAEQFRVATGVELAELDLGGGFGIAYTEADSPMPTDVLAQAFEDILDHECRGFGLKRPQLSIEPGRATSGPAGGAPRPAALGGRLRLRATLPMIGPAPDLVAIAAHADDLARNDRLPMPLREGLYLLTGMAGRGALYAAIGAEMIAARACGEPDVVDARLAAAVSPARFIKRRLQRAWSGRGKDLGRGL